MVSPGGPSELLSTGQVALLLGTSRQHVVDLCDSGKLPCHRVGTHRRVSLEHVIRFRQVGRAPSELTREQLKSLWLHQAVARRLLVEPEKTLRHARGNLIHLKGAHARGAAARSLAEWDRLLNGPMDELLEALTARTEWGSELRQNSPFAGVLTQHERVRILDTFRNHAA